MEERDWRGVIQTFTGKAFYPLEPRPEEICIEDIAHALSIQCRFGGHSKKPYRIAQHCVLVSKYCDKKDALWGMAHDFSEAYIADVCSPVKRHKDFQFYRTTESRLMSAICKRFSLPSEQPTSVTYSDELILAAEIRDLMGDLLPLPHWRCRNLDVSHIPTIVPLEFEKCKELFLNRFYELGGK